MFLIYNESTEPAYNLALEEYLLTERTESYIILWRNRRSVIIGRNQNAREEVDLSYARAADIAVHRRMTGGGAVFHDLGNINYSVIKDCEATDFSNYAEFAAPVIVFLRTLGITAVVSGRNDLEVEGRKISGNAQAVRKGRILHHGTLLYDADVTAMAQVLQPRPEKIAGKGVKSVRSRVMNLAGCLSEKLPPEEFIRQLYQYYVNYVPAVRETVLTAADITRIRTLAADKYAGWDWNVGQTPAYNYQKSRRFACGTVDLRLSVAAGIIRSARIYGDFFSLGDVAELTRQLCGRPHDARRLRAALDSINLDYYISGMTP